MGTGGTEAMHRVKSSFFMLALAGVATNLTDTVNQHLIKQWVDYNWPGVGAYPRLTHSRLDTRDTKELAEGIAALVTAGILTPDAGIEESVRTALELPEMPTDDGALRRVFARTKRRKTFAETVVNFAELEQGLDRGVATIIRGMRKVQDRQGVVLAKVARDIFNSKDRARVADINVPFKQDNAAVIRGVLDDLFDKGREETRRELRVQGLPASFAVPINEMEKKQIAQFLGLKAKALANLMADKVKSSVVWELLTQIRAGVYSEASLIASVNAISEREATKISGSVVTEALNLGRSSFAKSQKKMIRNVVYSSLLDGGTCVPCEQADGAEFAIGSPEEDRLAVPFGECDGRSRCRCVHVYVLDIEAK